MMIISLCVHLKQVLKESFAHFFVAVLKRKFLTGVLSYLLALILISERIRLLYILFILLFLFSLVYSIKRIRIRYITEAIIYMIVFFITGSFIMFLAESKDIGINNGDFIILEGHVTDREQLEYSDRYTVKINSPYSLCYIYTESGSEAFKIEDRVLAEGTVEVFETPRNDGGFDALSYYRGRNIRFSVEVENIQLVHRPAFSFGELLRRFREIIAQKIDKYMMKNSGLLKAILLGDKTGIEDYESELYQRGGISHILAISGLHVSNLSLLICFFLRRTGLPNNFSRVISVLILIVYAVFSGFSSSVVRAVIMFGVSNVALMISKDYDVPTAMSLSFFIYSLFYPYAYSSPGTVLSYAAVFSIWIFSINYKKVHKVKYPNKIHNFLNRKVLKTMYMSLFLTFFSFPLVLEFFYTIPIFSVVVNMYVVPAMTLLFMTAIAAVILSFINGLIASFLFKVCSLIISSFTAIVDISVDEFNGVLVPGKPILIEIIIYYMVFLLVLVLFNNIKRKYLLMSLLVIPLFFIINKWDRNSITMVDVDQGDCSIITTESGGVFMIDSGSTGESKIYKYTVEPYLLANGIEKIDYVFLSHSDMDHVNGIIEYMEKDISAVKISNIVITSQMYRDEDILEQIINKAKIKGINVKVMKAGDEIVHEGAYVSCLHPDYDAVSDDVNKDSMVLKLRIDGITALFTGDISSEVEEQLPVFDTDILKVSHHGSKTGTCEAFINKINPEIALISCGVDNSYGHPAKIVLDNLDKYNVKTYITANTGQVSIVLRNSECRLKTAYN